MKMSKDKSYMTLVQKDKRIKIEVKSRRLIPTIRSLSEVEVSEVEDKL